jgi:hypothetical protein
MASWRAGAVRSAVDAGLSEPMIMELGRWKSTAWRFYLLYSPVDVQGAACRMWTVVPKLEGDSSAMGSFQGAVPSDAKADSAAINYALAHVGVLSASSRKSVLKRATASCLSPPKRRRIR